MSLSPNKHMHPDVLKDWRKRAAVGRQATLRGKYMNPRKPVLASLALVVAASGASSAQEVWPKDSAGDLSIFVTLQRFQIYADHCSVKLPELKPKFDGLMERLNSHIQGISKSLLSSDMFGDMKSEPAPAEISFALKDSLDDAKHNLERKDADSICPKILQKLGQIDDDSLKSELMQTLVAVHSMTRNLENESIREASPKNRMQQSGSP